MLSSRCREGALSPAQDPTGWWEGNLSCIGNRQGGVAKAGIMRLGFVGCIGAPAEQAGKLQELQGEVRGDRDEGLGASEGSKQRFKDVVSCVFLELALAAARKTVYRALRQR